MQMNTFHINHIKLEKRNAVLRYNQLKKIRNLFRVIEFFFFLIVVSRFSFQLPPVFKLSGEYFQHLSVMLLSPSFVFIIGNTIVVILFAKSRHFSLQNPSADHGKTDIYEQECKKIQGKQRMAEENKVMASDLPSSEIKIYRSKSEKLRNRPCEKNCSELRRSSTEKVGKCSDCWKESGAGEANYPEDHMTNEEFRQTIEAFIARQQRFLREEEFSAIGAKVRRNDWIMDAINLPFYQPTAEQVMKLIEAEGLFALHKLEILTIDTSTDMRTEGRDAVLSRNWPGQYGDPYWQDSLKK